MQALQDLIGFFRERRIDDFPTAVREAARNVILDDAAAILAGSVLEETQSLREFVRRHFAAGTAFMAPRGSAAPAGAALVNGTAAVALEVDEGNRYTFGHPGAHVLPALWASLGDKDVDGASFVVALVAGYEVAARMARAATLWPDAHPHGTWGAMGGAAALGILRGRTVEEIARAVAVAGHLSLHTAFGTALRGSTVRNVYAGYAALSALVADEAGGVTAAGDGLADVFRPFDAARLTEGLGSIYYIPQNYFKPYAACRYTHGTIDALTGLRAEIPGPNSVKSIRIETYEIASRLTGWPHNTLSAKFSIPWAAAAALEGCADDPTAFLWSEERSGRFARWRDLVDVAENPEFSAMVPDLRPTSVEVQLRDGRTLRRRIDLPQGEGTRPLGLQDLRRKAVRLLSSAGFPDAVAEAWAASAGALPDSDSAKRSLEAPLQGAI